MCKLLVHCRFFLGVLKNKINIIMRKEVFTFVNSKHVQVFYYFIFTIIIVIYLFFVVVTLLFIIFETHLAELITFLSTLHD